MEIVIFSHNYEEKEVGSIITVRMRITFVLSSDIWAEVLYLGGARG